MAHAVWYEPMPSSRFRASAEVPLFEVARNQAAANQTVSGARVSWKIVPAVRDTRWRQPAQRHTDPAIALPLSSSQCGHTNPSGHRSQSR